MKLKEIRIFTHGDPSVGINGSSCQVVADGDYILDKVQLENVRTILKEAFGEIFDEKTQVHFEFEDTVEVSDPRGNS